MNIKKEKIIKILGLIGIGGVILGGNNSFAGCDGGSPHNRTGDNLNVDVSDIVVQGKRYNLKKDLGLPNLQNFSHSKSGTFTNGSLYRPRSFYRGSSFYNLYTVNGEKWGICKPYYLTGHCWQGGDYANNARNVSSFGKIASGTDDFGLLFWIPFSYENGIVSNKLNITTQEGHINGTLNESDINFNFSFY